jgi:hypothetical protein
MRCSQREYYVLDDSQVKVHLLVENAAKILLAGRWPHHEFGWVIQLRYDQNGALRDGTIIKENLRPD